MKVKEQSSKRWWHVGNWGIFITMVLIIRPYWEIHKPDNITQDYIVHPEIDYNGPGCPYFTDWVEPKCCDGEISIKSPGLDPPFPFLQVRTVVIVMASSVYISCVGLCGYVNRFVDRSDEEGGLLYADQWQHPRVVTLAAEVAGRGWNCFSFCEVEAGTRRRQPLVEFFSLYEYIHLLMLALWQGTYFS